jgi:hypothetical protein
MTRITRIITAAPASLAILAPVATAMPSRGAVRTSSVAGTPPSLSQREAPLRAGSGASYALNTTIVGEET